MLLKEVNNMTLRSQKFSSKTGHALTTSPVQQQTDKQFRNARYPAIIPYRIDLQDENTSGRQALQEFIYDTFRRTYGANVQHYLPRLMSLTNHKDELIAAVGFHAAQNEPLFLEQYLDNPIENVISESVGYNIQRGKIMEVGNLAVATAGGARGLIIALTSYIKGAGFDWVVFTAVPSLINSFKKLGLEIIPLAEARKDLLITNHDQWGSYYDLNPMVVAGDVRKGFGKLEQLLLLEHGLNVMQALWNHAYAAGYQRRKGYQFYCDNSLAP